METRIFVGRNDRSLVATDDVQSIEGGKIFDLRVPLDLTPPNDIDHGVACLELATIRQSSAYGIRWNPPLLHTDGCVASQTER